MTDDQKPAVVLLVEDEALVRMFADEVLVEDGGFRVISAANADEAIAILRVRTDVRVLFTDVNMPGSMDGLALAHAVHVGWPDVAIVVTSGLNLTGPLPPGARFLTKPYAPLALVDTIRTLIGERPGDAPAPIILPREVVPEVAPARPAPVLPRPALPEALLGQADPAPLRKPGTGIED
ncbi:response regulator [Salinarimonas soli]|uniref:response regulator n=1 Tax=Salinarimonas soli TaxID=1638099 RepID=UPI001AEEE174|nr:response regulator [Salinarimonas soli]